MASRRFICLLVAAFADCYPAYTHIELHLRIVIEIRVSFPLKCNQVHLVSCRSCRTTLRRPNCAFSIIPVCKLAESPCSDWIGRVIVLERAHTSQDVQLTKNMLGSAQNISSRNSIQSHFLAINAAEGRHREDFDKRNETIRASQSEFGSVMRSQTLSCEPKQH